MILVAGFAIAATLIVLSLLMNSAIYTENLATRSESSGATDANAYHRAIESSALDVFRYANEVNRSDHAGLERNVTQAMSELSNLSTRQEVTRGHVPNVSVASVTEGTKIDHNGSGFTNAAGDHNWTVAHNVEGVRAFNISVDDRSHLNPMGSKEFRVVANDSTNTWHMNITFNTLTSESTIGVNTTNGYDTCTTSDDPFWVNVTEGTVAGDSCDALDWGEGLSGPYKLEFRNASAIDGTYSMVVDGNVVSFASGGPSRRPVLYAMTTSLVYRTPELQYRSEIRIAPGEPDE